MNSTTRKRLVEIYEEVEIEFSNEDKSLEFVLEVACQRARAEGLGEIDAGHVVEALAEENEKIKP